MKFSGFTSYKTGVLIPVFSLRSGQSCGCGEFADLKILADWCEKAGLDTIQLLPVNDTGDDPSPYNALSAFALHPVYCRIDDIPELASMAPELQKKVFTKINKLKKNLNPLARVAYAEVLTGKLTVLNEIYEYSRSLIDADKKFTEWVSANPWVREYGVFRTLKAHHNHAGWQSWRPEFKNGNTDVIARVWKDPVLGDRARYYAWVQFRLEEQFLATAMHLSKMGIMLKGDIPIMMNEDSADVWAHGANFQLDQRAGAPPDMFAQMGQNWGFPIYNWDYLAAHDYDWWRQRLLQADKFYHAYRIDHVLGFFRIWTIDRNHREGLLGYFRPSIYVSSTDLHSLGFDNGRIKWLAEPHVYGWKLHELFGMRSVEITARCFNRIGNEDLYIFKPEITGEKSLYEIPLIDHECDLLLGLYRDRALISVDDGLWSTSWTFRDCSRYQGLNEQEKLGFEELVARRGRESEELWQKNGEKLLRFMKETVPMLTCAEDLGVIPQCVPQTLQQLEILSLKIPRWAREWNREGSPFIRVEDYPFLSVCAPSVHDTSTLREWWETDNDKWIFWDAMQFGGACPEHYSSETAKKVIARLLQTGSAMCMFQIQDLFALEPAYFVSDPATERVNIPGTVQTSNWSYRIPMLVEDLIENSDFAKRIKEMTFTRNQRALAK